MVHRVCIDHNQSSEFTIWRLLLCPPLLCSFGFLFDPEATICHWWGIKSKWLKNHMHECQLIFKWCIWSVLIIIHVLTSQVGGYCYAYHCFPVACSYLTQRPTFATGEESSQSDWQRTGMGTSSAAAATWPEKSSLIFQSLKPWLESLFAEEL
jgi:hypothetical protein